MNFVYFLKSQSTGRFYIGKTSNLKERMSQHQRGKVYSTRRFVPWILVYFEAYGDLDRATIRERKLKQFGSAYAGLLNRLSYK
ncbi:MAG: GIY-YIG nuclease family protein [bacterium]